jgi:hypothetical protein
LCHGECTSNSLKDGFDVKSLSYALRKIVKFLGKNPNEIVTIFLEDYLQETSKLEDVFKRVKNLTSLVFNPYAAEWDVVNKGWPRVHEMIRSNKRLLIIDDEQRGQHANKRNGIIRSRDYLLQNHYEWFNDVYDWTVTNTSDDELFRALDQKNLTQMELHMSRCFSFHRLNNKPNWGEGLMLNGSSKETRHQLINSDKLFLFNHFYGVSAASAFINPLTVQLMNSREFIYKRIREKCDPYTNGTKPNYISLDFIDETTYEQVIQPMNSKHPPWPSVNFQLNTNNANSNSNSNSHSNDTNSYSYSYSFS